MVKKIKNKTRKNMNQRGQVTIFIILAMLIVVVIAILFLLIKKPDLQIEDVENPQAYVESCVKEFTQEAINLLSEQGGFIEPKSYKMHQGANIGYLCYTGEYYKTCRNQRPMLIEHVEEEITNYISPKVDNCFHTLKGRLEAKNYIIEMGNMNLITKIQPQQVVIDINRDFKMTKRESTRHFNDFKMILVHPIYDLLKISLKILNGESSNCQFDYVDYVMLHQEYDIRKFLTGDSIGIYNVRDKFSKESFKFAVRSCVLPPGF